MLAALSSVASTALGELWFFQPTGSVGTGYEENVDLAEEDPTNTSNYALNFAARGGRVAERSQIVGSLLASLRRYPGNKRLDTDNLAAELDFAFLPTELDRLSLDLRLKRETSRLSELTTTGNITTNVPRNEILIAPAWQRRLTERSVVGVEYAHTSVRFENNSSGLINYDQDEIDVFYGYQLTERLGLSSSLGATSYDPDDVESYKGYQALLGLSFGISETLTGDLNVGLQRIDSETDLGGERTSRSASGITYGFELSKQFERSNLGLAVSRGAVPTGSAEPLLQENLSLGYGYQFSPRLSVTVPAAIFRNESISFGGGVGQKEEERRVFFTTRPALNWRVTEDLVLSASYRYRYQRFEQAGTSADSNAVFLSLSYAWPTEFAGLSR